jgi:cell division protein FtsW (lipid II flippase)
MRSSQKMGKTVTRPIEATALTMIVMIAVLGFLSVAAAAQVRQEQDPILALPGALVPSLLIAASLVGFHIFLRSRRMQTEQIIWPSVSLLFVVGAVMIWRLLGWDGVFSQLSRGLIPGMVIAGWLVARPQWIEKVRQWAPLVGLLGLLLPIVTSLFGVVDETGARLALKLGPLPAIQTSEVIKLAMIIFLAWYVEEQGRAAEGRARTFLGWMRIPALQYFIPGALFVAVATLALVRMSDYGAVLILGCIFVAILFAGFEPRVFMTVAAIGLVLAVLAGLILALTWEIPAVIQYRFMAFLNPWSTAVITLNGQSTGITISEGPGYQIQQAIYAVVSGGITGRGLGFGSPDYVPLAHSDFILAAIIEEFGAIIGVAVLFLFAVLLLRIFRTVSLLPPGQIFERLLLVGIGAHLFTQVFVMASGTLNLLPVTGITVPFLSQGGVALLINLTEVGIVLAIARRLEGLNP